MREKKKCSRPKRRKKKPPQPNSDIPTKGGRKEKEGEKGKRIYIANNNNVVE